jgi:acetoin utilization deacetylase AcuC-like enzyme
MLPFRLVYHDRYDLNFGQHVFPSQKYKLIRERLLKEEFASLDDFVEPEPVSVEDLLLAHDAGWIQRLTTGTLSYQEILTLEIPYSRQMVDAFILAAGGTLLASRLALRDGIGFNVGGGFHHAFPGHGEGFCAINDMAVAVRRLQKEGQIERAMIVDCDVHQANGTAVIFKGDEKVFTFSIHQFNNYPSEKPPSDLDINLPDEVNDDDYLAALRAGYLPAIAEFRPQLVVYVAGADPYFQDQLGGLALTLHGLKARDRLVIETALRQGAAVAVTLAGGYAYSLNDTVTIHSNTARAAKEALELGTWLK